MLAPGTFRAVQMFQQVENERTDGEKKEEKRDVVSLEN